MKRKIFIALTILICFLLQSTVFQSLAVASISPNLLIVLVSSYGFMRGKREGMFVGFFCGLLEDIFYGRLLGMHALLYMFIGYGNGYFNSIFYGEDIKLPIGLITFSELLYGLGTYVIMFLMRSRFAFWFYLRRIILPELLYTLVVMLFLYRIVYLVDQKLGGEN
ncbi:MAG: rod shape-determining protein MreD [Lachnospiraceae bacterium]|nr:rod shape-determining protein MreD [Lachnospiraceae bacterium]